MAIINKKPCEVNMRAEIQSSFVARQSFLLRAQDLRLRYFLMLSHEFMIHVLLAVMLIHLSRVIVNWARSGDLYA